MNLDAKTKKKLDWIIVGLAGATVILFFLPALKINYFLGELSVSQCILAFGSDELALDFNFLGLLQLLLPISIPIFILFLKNNTAKYASSIGASVLDVLFLAITVGMLKDDMGGGYLDLSDLLKVTFWLVLVYIFMILVALICAFLLLAKSDKYSGDMQKVMGVIGDSAAKVSSKISAVGTKKVCQVCGAEINWDGEFCPKCGTKYVPPMVKKCQVCGAVLTEDDVFCQKCGTKYEAPVDTDIVCPSCGMKNPEDSMFCQKCGTKLK